MDRRQKKSQEAILEAFTTLLAQKSYHKITVQDIIETANVGRTTFYAHYETKDFLLKAFCERLFRHILSSALEGSCTCGHGMRLGRNGPQFVFLHLLHHLEENENHVLDLLASEGNEIFLRFFKNSLNDLIRSRFMDGEGPLDSTLPPDFLVNHISGSFVEMVFWWIKRRMRETPEELDGYFRAVIEPIFQREEARS